MRLEQPADAESISSLLRVCFPGDGEARLVGAEGLIVGHVAFSPVSTAAGAVGLGCQLVRYGPEFALVP